MNAQRNMGNPLNTEKKRPAPVQSGYTKPDRAVRCKKCFVGSDEAGGSIGTPIAVYTVSCAMPEGGSVAVATVPMCYKCREILPFITLAAGRNMGMTGINIIRCLKARKGLLAIPWFTLEELLTGKIEQATDLSESAQPQPIERTEVVVPENIKEEEQAVSLF